MKILLFGGSGQLGYELRVRAHDLNFEIVSPVSSEVDVGNEGQLRTLASQVKPDIVVNCAAYTAVDKAEVERENAFRINREGAKNSARAAADLGVRLIHVSTDYVFSGSGTTPLTEADPTGPINVYGESKLAGEQEATRILGDRALILRTASLHGQKGVNFVNTMLKLFAEKPSLKIVDDQYMSPTWAGWLAEVILDLSRIDTGGVVHASGEGTVSWYDFACAIRDWSKPASSIKLDKISTAEFGRPARRPMFSAFDCSKLSKLLGRRPITWQEGLKRHLGELGALRNEISIP